MVVVVETEGWRGGRQCGRQRGGYGRRGGDGMSERARVFLERLEGRSGDVDGAMYIPSFWTGVDLRPRQLVVK